MKNIFLNGNLRRVVYLIGGLFFALTAISDRTWWLLPFALYFIAMSLMGFGCAGPNCRTPFNKEP